MNREAIIAAIADVIKQGGESILNDEGVDASVARETAEEVYEKIEALRAADKSAAAVRLIPPPADNPVRLWPALFDELIEAAGQVLNKSPKDDDVFQRRLRRTLARISTPPAGGSARLWLALFDDAGNRIERVRLTPQEAAAKAAEFIIMRGGEGECSGRIEFDPNPHDSARDERHFYRVTACPKCGSDWTRKFTLRVEISGDSEAEEVGLDLELDETGLLIDDGLLSSEDRFTVLCGKCGQSLAGYEKEKS